MTTYKDKSILLSKISVLFDIGFTVEEVTSYLHDDPETLKIISVVDQQVWKRDRIIHPTDPYHSLRRMGLLNSFDMLSLGNPENRGRDADFLSQYYLWEDESISYHPDDEQFVLRYIYRYWLTTSSGSINPIEPALGDPGLEKMFGIPLRSTFRKITSFESKEHYVETIREAAVFNHLCMAVVEHGILRDTLHSDLEVLLTSLKQR